MQREFFRSCGHICTLEQDDDMDVMQRIADSNPLANGMRLSFLISSESPRTHKLFSSQFTIANERRRHLLSNPFVIHPYSTFRIYFDVLMILVLLFLLTLIPLQFVIFDPLMKMYIGLGNFFYLIFIFINFNTGYLCRKTSTIELSYCAISINYLFGFGLIDILSTIPFFLYWFANFQISSDSDSDVLELVQQIESIGCVLLCLKIFRLRTLARYIVDTMEFFNFNDINAQSIVLICLYGFMILHFAACAQLMKGFVDLHIFERNKVMSEWFDKKQLGVGRYFVIYSVSFYRAMNAMAGVGSDLFEPTSITDIAFVSFLVISGRICMIYLLGMIMQIIQAFTTSTNKKKEIIHQLEDYAKYQKLPRVMRRKLFTYFEHQFNSTYYYEKEILADLSSQLRREIQAFQTGVIMRSITFFSTIPGHIAVRILSCLHSEFLMEHEKLYETDDTDETSSLYFVLHGTLAHYSPSGIEIFHAIDGDYTGEMCLLTNHRHRMCTCTAVEPTELRLMYRDDFLRIIESYPDLEDAITRKAAGRLEIVISAEDKLRRRMQSIKTKRNKEIKRRMNSKKSYFM